MRYASNAKIVKTSKIVEGITINNNDTIIDKNFNIFTDDLNKKNLEIEKRNESTNMAIII